MSLQPIGLHQRFRMRIFTSICSHSEISANPRSDHRTSVRSPRSLHLRCTRVSRAGLKSRPLPRPLQRCRAETDFIDPCCRRVGNSREHNESSRWRGPARQHADACAPQNGHFKIELAGYITPFLMTVSISEAFLISSSGFELRITRSAK
jgi:hypothetical protein